MGRAIEVKRILPGPISFGAIAFFAFCSLVGVGSLAGAGFSSSTEIALMVFGLLLTFGCAVGVWWFTEWVVVDATRSEITFRRLFWSRSYSTANGVFVLTQAVPVGQAFEIEILIPDGAAAVDPVRPLGWGSPFCLRRFTIRGIQETASRLRQADVRPLAVQIEDAVDTFGRRTWMVRPHLEDIYQLSREVPGRAPFPELAEIVESRLRSTTGFDAHRAAVEMKAVLQSGE